MATRERLAPSGRLIPGNGERDQFRPRQMAINTAMAEVEGVRH